MLKTMTFKVFCDVLKKLKKNPYGDLVADRVNVLSDMAVSNQDKVVYLFATDNPRCYLTRHDIFSELVEFRYNFPVFVVLDNNEVRGITSMSERQEDSDSEVYTLISTRG